jgi:thioredoxin-related protein
LWVLAKQPAGLIANINLLFDVIYSLQVSSRGLWVWLLFYGATQRSLMQKLLIIIMLLVSLPTAFAQSDKLVWENWNEGYEKAIKTNKILLVDTYTEWCGWCKKMDRDTYSNPEVIKKLNQYFVVVKFNPEIACSTYKVGDQTLSNKQLYSMLCQGKSTGFPTTYYITPSKNSLVIDPGYKGPEEFLKILDKAITNAKK